MEESLKYDEYCKMKFSSDEKVIIFSFRILIETIAILSSLFILITIYKSEKKAFWPFKVAFCQVFAELVDLIGAVAFTVNSSCYPEICSIFGYVMHCNWLASLLFSLFITVNYFCIIKLDNFFNFFLKHIECILGALYIIPYLFYGILYLQQGFGPSGWVLKDGDFFFLFCGCINIIYVVVDDRITLWWITPVSTLFATNLFIAIQNYRNLKTLSTYQELAFSSRRIRFVIWIPTIYFSFWMMNFFLRAFVVPQNSEGDILVYNSMNWPFYIFYVFFNLTFELHLTLGAFLFYVVYTYLFRYFKGDSQILIKYGNKYSIDREIKYYYPQNQIVPQLLISDQ